MQTKFGALALLLILTGAAAQGCIFGGGDDGLDKALSRSGPIPTATLPASLPEPVLVGQGSAGGGTTPVSGGAAGTYTVQSGDTLFAIASALGVPPDQQGAWAAEVLRINGIPDATRLSAGQELRLPAQTARATGTPAAGATPARTPTTGATATAAAATATAPSATSTPPAATATPQAQPTATAAAGSAGTYTVQSGDYPFLIAEKLGVPSAQWQSWTNELVALNNINPNSLVVGTVLRLPAGTPGR